jgi:CheY-like chemotaxis protein
MRLESSAESPQSSSQSSSLSASTPAGASGQPDWAETSAAAAPGSSQQDSDQRRILVIENNVEAADLITSLLESEGYAVELATDGQYGLMLADSFGPELILLDTNLPGMSSSEMTQILRSAPQFGARFRYTRILYLAEQRHIIQQRFHSLPGAPIADYVFKPIDAKLLLERVQRCFEEIDSGPQAQ